MARLPQSQSSFVFKRGRFHLLAKVFFFLHLVLVNRLGGLRLPRNSVVRLTDLLDITIVVYRGHKMTKEQQKQQQRHSGKSTIKVTTDMSQLYKTNG